MISLNDRLLVAEEEFLSALDGGGQSISAFNVRWDKLLVDLDDAAASGEMDPELSHLAYNAAMRLSALADTSIELYNSYDAVTSRLMDQVESLMEELTISDVSRSRRADIPSTCEDMLTKSRKRRRSSTPASSLPSSAVPFPLKRARKSFTQQDHGVQPLHVPSEIECRGAVSLPDGRASVSTSFGLARKRRCSDADASAPSPPSKRIHVGPRVHAVSDSFLPSYLSRPPRRVKACPTQPSIVLPTYAENIPIATMSPAVDMPESSCDTEVGFEVNSLSRTAGGTSIALSELDVFLNALLAPAGAYGTASPGCPTNPPTPPCHFDDGSSTPCQKRSPSPTSTVGPTTPTYSQYLELGPSIYQHEPYSEDFMCFNDPLSIYTTCGDLDSFDVLSSLSSSTERGDGIPPAHQWGFLLLDSSAWPQVSLPIRPPPYRSVQT